MAAAQAVTSWETRAMLDDAPDFPEGMVTRMETLRTALAALKAGANE